MTAEAEANSLELQRQTYAAFLAHHADVARYSKLEISEHARFIADELAFRVKAVVWARHLGENIVRYPANWWQHFKQRWFPQWALERWPVLETVIVIEAFHEYPGVVLHSTEPRLRYHQQERSGNV